jgi:hypothetical protein
MTSIIRPIYFNEELTEEQITHNETSNGIYISQKGFKKFMTDDTDEFIALEISFDNRCVICHIIGTHYSGTNIIFAPGWICNLLGTNNDEDIHIKRVFPSMGTKIIIKPQNTSYTQLPDPVEALRNAFENYSCLISGIEIPLNVGGEILHVSILDTNTEGPICIRGVELEVEIVAEITENSFEFNSILPLPSYIDSFPDKGGGLNSDLSEFNSMLPMPTHISAFPGEGRVLKDYNCNKRRKR